MTFEAWLYWRLLSLYRWGTSKFGRRIFAIDGRSARMHRMAYDLISPSAADSYVMYGDYPRYRALELVAEQIREKDVSGNVAEVGVFLGDFSFMINQCFSDRKCFLYDTFDGYADQELEDDRIRRGGGGDFMRNHQGVYRRTSSDKKIEIVKSKMPFLDQCVFRKGYFPETAAPDVDEKFAFVSIDVNVYKAIYASLEFFYPRVSEGGYIFVHDYNQIEMAGVKQAVRDFEEAFDSLKRVPLPDQAGTLVIAK